MQMRIQGKTFGVGNLLMCLTGLADHRQLVDLPNTTPPPHRPVRIAGFHHQPRHQQRRSGLARVHGIHRSAGYRSVIGILFSLQQRAGLFNAIAATTMLLLPA